MLDGKVVIVTGGCGLIGSSMVRAIADNGGTAIIADLDMIKGEALSQEINKKCARDAVMFQQLDITNKTSLNSCIDILVNKYGKISALINNAYPRNKNYGKDFFDVEYEDFCCNVSMHLGGYFLTSQQFAKYFVKQGYGNIINISSIYGVVPPRFEIYAGTKMSNPVEYAAIKSAVIHLTKFMARRLAGNNIKINSISFGGIYDNQPSSFLDKYKGCCIDKGMLDTADVVGGVLFMLSDESRYINGQNLIIDDGFCL